MDNFNGVSEASTSVELLSALKNGFEHYSVVNHNELEAGKVHDDFCEWRQKLGGLLTWYKCFSDYKDYGGAIHASMALGKFGAAPKPSFTVVSEKDQDDLNVLCDLIWTDIRAGIRTK